MEDAPCSDLGVFGEATDMCFADLFFFSPVRLLEDRITDGSADESAASLAAKMSFAFGIIILLGRDLVLPEGLVTGVPSSSAFLGLGVFEEDGAGA